MQTFQAVLYPDGRIEFAYGGAASANAVVGISPGNVKGGSRLVSFRNDPSSGYAGSVAERFGKDLSIDTITVAQRFYETHEDAYDYLVIYNNMDIPAAAGAVAYENTVRNGGSGFGVETFDSGSLYGSDSRLQAVLNMGMLSQYPRDPTALVPLRRASGDTPLTVLGHEAGHRFLAFASVRDPADPTARPMLGAQLAHWSFVFNSEASLLEGERIVDREKTVSPRFLTTDTVQGYAPLDQYLMGFAPAEQVAPTFLATGVLPQLPAQHPLRNYAFDGDRRDILVDDVIAAEGRRTPDYTVAQRRFRFAFLLVAPQGGQPGATEIAQVEAYRQQFEPFYTGAASGRATADTTLKKSVKLSLYPAAGVVAGTSVQASLAVASAPAEDLTIALSTANGNGRVPATVTIRAGTTGAPFLFAGLQTGVEELLVTPADPAYETAYARVQVADGSMLKLVVVGGGPPEPVVVRLTDVNDLPYAGARLTAATDGGTLDVVTATTDAQGRASFLWTPDQPVSRLKVSVADAPDTTVTLTFGEDRPGGLSY
jgi:hypothetical protein